ncbi:hypothetical protein ACF0H5_003548 [Mactra antiquata]
MYSNKHLYIFITVIVISLCVPLWLVFVKSDSYKFTNYGLKFVGRRTWFGNTNITKKLRVGVLIPSTTRYLEISDIKKFSLIDTLFKSFYKTIQTEYNYTIYVGIDTNDKLKSYIHDIESFGDNIIVVRVNGSTFTKAVNTIAEKAVKDGVDYLMRINDDTQFITSNWTSLCIESLQNFDPPNIGVVGPLCPQDKQTILTQDFVHVTHFHIFGFYYPPQLDNWWADDWITRVYESRSMRLTAWKVKHLVKARRYRVNMHHEKLLPQFISQGNKTLTSYINRNIINITTS